MAILKSIFIDGFWDNHSLEAAFQPDVNFVVGVNGSGKTTFIELIAASLTGNVQDLIRINFSRIEAVIGEKKSKEDNKLLISKTENKIEFIYKSSKQKGSFKHSIDISNPFVKGVLVQHKSKYEPEEWLFSSRFIDYEHDRLSAKLKKIASVDWLPVLRSKLLRNTDENKSRSDVDHKLRHVSDNLENYFNILGTEVDNKLKDLQQAALLSLLEVDNEGIAIPEEKNITKAKNQINDLFQALKIPSTMSAGKIDAYFEGIQHWHTFKNEPDNKKKGFAFQKSFPSILTWGKLHSIINRYNDFIINSQSVYKPRDLLLETINSFFQRKKIILQDNKRLGIKTVSGKELSIFDLSSGEKQLLILLGECLLQKRNEWIYIADEPELSMHVTWQNKLVKTLKEINPSAQIIFATHSPEIIAEYPDKCIFDLESYIR